MEREDDLPTSTADLLQTLISPLSSSAKLSNQSRALSSGKDFHFFNNFPDFKLPVRQISAKAGSSLQTLASSKSLFGSKTQPPLPEDLDDSYDWLVNLNDELMERFSVSMDEFKSLREKREEKVGSLAYMEEGGFQLVYGKNKSRKKGGGRDEVGSAEGSLVGIRAGLKERKVAGLKSRVPFHIPTIPRPQDQFNILVNNVNQPFEHVWLERSEDGNRVIHPLEKLSVLDFVDRSIKDSEMVEPLPLERTPFKLVEGVKELKELAAKLRDAREFAVDLEHNQYRSFQGLTCLMQISTRTEDFIVDTLKLRVHIGPYLREVFKDPSKKKVMHGADHDIEWLQRDFGIYVCNLFDTGQASRVLQLERNSLEYLLCHFCGVHADKEYQNAEWRLRPLPAEMIKYAREDTHYLLHIYDLMRQRLLSESTDCTDLLLEVYKRSYDVCNRLYQKELLTDTSFLYIYGLQEADFDSKQLAIIAGLHAWRDKVGRDEDESTGYILPNKTLLEIAKQMPVSSGKLRQLMKSKHSYVGRHLNTVVHIIKSSIENSSAFETITEQLKQARLESSKQNKEEADDNSEPMVVTEDPMDSMACQRGVSDVITSNAGIMQTSVDIPAAIETTNTQTVSDQIVSARRCQQDDKLQSMSSTDIGGSFGILGAAATTEKERIGVGQTAPLNSTKNASIASIQISKKQSSAFGALLGNSASRRKLNRNKGGIGDQDMNVNKVELIKSSVSLPFLSFSCGGNLSAPGTGDSVKHLESETPEQLPDQPSETTKLEDVIVLENDETESPSSPSKSPLVNDDNNNGGCQPELEREEEPSSLSDLSFSFQQCFQSISQRKGNSRKNQKQSQKPDPIVHIKPFDYEAARKSVKFGEFEKHVDGGDNEKTCSESRDKRKGSVKGRGNGKERTKGLRRHAFPSSGNRSTIYK